MSKIIVKQVRSMIGSTPSQKKTLEALGLKRVNAQREHDATPQILGMVKKVHHLVSVEEI